MSKSSNTYMTKLLSLFLLSGLMTLAGCGDHGHDHDNSAGDHGQHEASDYERGPNNGRMLRDGPFAIELAIFETGVPPEFRAWATYDGLPVSPEAVDLSVQLIRLGGADDIRFATNGDHLRGDTVIYEPHSFAVEVKSEYQSKTYTWAYDSFEGRTLIEPGVASAFGLITKPAGPAIIKQHVRSYGLAELPARSQHRVTARFDGQIQSIEVDTGDSVRKGQTLLTIESNDSLQSYALKSPAKGVVLNRNANPGEQTDGRVLLQIADPSTIWVMLSVFPNQQEVVRVGQTTILLDADGGELSTETIDWISPVRNSDQSLSARVVLDNRSGKVHSGQFIQAEIEVAEFEVPLAVKRSALQGFRDFTVVYGKFGDQYEVRMLELGRQGREMVEVLGGIEPGTPYVTTNSYLVKADIEKSGASHDH